MFSITSGAQPHPGHGSPAWARSEAEGVHENRVSFSLRGERTKDDRVIGHFKLRNSAMRPILDDCRRQYVIDDDAFPVYGPCLTLFPARF
jgi:hypothetical protein